MSVVGQGTLSGHLPDDAVDRVVQDGLGRLPIDGRRVLVIVPDGTRTMPMPFMFDAIERAMGPRVQAMDFLIALGTHAPMSDAALSKHVGRTVVNGLAGSRRIFNHRWDDPSTFLTLGSIPAADVAALTEGRLREADPGRAEPARRRVRPRPHLRACVPARSRRVLGRDQVPLPGHRRARNHPLHALARRAPDELQGHRHRGHTCAHDHRPGGGSPVDTVVSARARGDTPRAWPARTAATCTRRGARPHRCQPAGTSSGSIGRSSACCR